MKLSNNDCLKELQIKLLGNWAPWTFRCEHQQICISQMPKLSSTQFPNQWIFFIVMWPHHQHKSKKARFEHQWQLMLSWKNTPPVEATFSYTSTRTKTKYALLVLWQRADKSGNFTSKYSANTRSKLYILQWGKTTHVPLKTPTLKVAHLTTKDSMSGGEKRN